LSPGWASSGHGACLPDAGRQVPSGRWKAELSTQEAAVITTACAPFLQSFGYAG